MATFTNRQLFYVNSSNRLGGTNSNFSYQLNVNPNVEFNKATVLEVSIPKSYYLIEEGYNTFILWEGLEEVTITIPPANYNKNSLQNTLVTLLNAASIHSWTYTIEYPNTQRVGDTGKFIYKVSGNGVVQPEFHFANACYEAMGFEENGEYEFVGNQLQSVNVIKLQAEDTLYIHSNLVSNVTDNILQQVFVNGDPSYASINWINPCPEANAKDISVKNSTNFTFYLTDENDQPIDLNGLNMQFVILMYKEQDIYSMQKDFMKYLMEYVFESTFLSKIKSVVNSFMDWFAKQP